MSTINRQVFVGKSGKVYIDGVQIAYIESINAKLTGNFEDINCCGEWGTGVAYTGYSGDGQVVMHYTNTEYADRVIEDFQNGIMTEHTIVATMTNQNTNKTASYSIQDAVFTEITPIDFSTGVAKHTLPFRCTTIKPISRVSA